MEERIKYLFKQYLYNTCTRKEFDEFFSYINEAAHNELIRELIKKAYEESGQPGSSLTYVNERGNLIVTKPNWNEQPGTRRKTTPKMRVVGAIAAVAMALVIGFAWLMLRPPSRQPPAEIKGLAIKMTGRSEYRYMLLPDSTQVWLNAASTLEYPQQFAMGKREVYLTGEAYFDVKHADKQPFLIHTGKVTTMVLGTAFNIKAYPGRENIIVSVSRGKVRVNYNEKEMAVLTQGQQVKVSNTSNTIIQKKMAITEAAPWQQGNLQYDDEIIKDIVADLERNYDVTIRIQNEAVANERISTSFRREIGIENALKVLCTLTDTRLKLENNMYVIQ
ncbi:MULTISPECIES: FecR family protein [Niastella]|uniref:FecR domain-containing protein n=1 Tax=Niastella soli TaxID=2821487 RepID=A0ABS3YQ21_9BACT|nr:FecR domain-containing protein [Niastella soli]MBO9199997.1 FecR domain-containing protein [Niastella soli]